MCPAPPSSARIVAITGASSGIGRATARAFAARGDHVVLIARRADELDRTLQSCGGRGRVIVCDVGEREQVQAAAASIRELEGACHVLVNNAGIGARSPFDGPDAIDELERVMAVNFFGAARLTAELLPLLRSSAPSAVVNVSSIAGLYGSGLSPSYCASKFALTGLSESLHFALARSGVHVANVQPGPVVTEGWNHRGLAQSRLWRHAIAPVDDVAQAIVRAADRRGTPFPVIPRFFRWGQLLRDLAPPAYRALLRRTAPPVAP